MSGPARTICWRLSPNKLDVKVAKLHFTALNTELTILARIKQGSQRQMQYFLTCGVLVKKYLKEVIRTLCDLCLFFLTSILAAFNVGDLVFEVMVYADTTRCSWVSHKELPLSHAGCGLIHQGRYPVPSGTTNLYTITRSDCTSLQPLDAGRETTVAVSTMADPTVKGSK